MITTTTTTTAPALRASTPLSWGLDPSYRVAFTRISKNKKTGPLPVTTSEARTCPPSCGMFAACYAKAGPLALFWAKVSDGRAGLEWGDFLLQVKALPKGQLWRHNQSGDLAGIGDVVDPIALAQLVQANRGRKGFTYTHKPVEGLAGLANRTAIEIANREGFTINLSADDLAEADRLADLGVAPVTVVLPSDQLTATKTPAGRSVAICPATIAENVTCATCGLCQLRDRKAIIGFPAHGTSKRKASAIAEGGAA